MSEQYQKLLSSIKVGNIIVRNRTIMAPMNTNYANADGSISITGGQIGLNGTVRIEGSLYVNGEKYEPNGGVL